jgi:hypothetical protein
MEKTDGVVPWSASTAAAVIRDNERLRAENETLRALLRAALMTIQELQARLAAADDAPARDYAGPKNPTHDRVTMSSATS